MTVRVIDIRRAAREPHANQRHDVGGRVGQRVEPVRQDRDEATAAFERAIGLSSDPAARAFLRAQSERI